MRIVNAASVFLCILVGALWLRSYWGSDTFGFSPHCGVQTDRGELVFAVLQPHSNFSIDVGYSKGRLPDPNDPWNPRRVADRTWTIWLAHGDEFPGLELTIVRFWALFVVAALPLFIVPVRRARVRWRVTRGACSVCGYDLRHSPHHCPECGNLRDGSPQLDHRVA